MRTNQFGHKLTKSKAEWIRKLKSKLKNGDIDPVLWGAHFEFTETYVECRDCGDFRSNVCHGGKDPIECFEESTRLSKKHGQPRIHSPGTEDEWS